MSVKIGHASIDENVKTYGGKAGDQNGKEVYTRNWYKHSKGWRVFRAKDPVKAEKIALAMQAACDNDNVGYDQYQRNTLYAQAEKVGFDVSKVATACETDCSALVRVCCAYAGILGLPSGFRTRNMPTNLMNTGEFVELKGSKYTDQDIYLGRGDILVTKTSGHTVVALTNGTKYEGTIEDSVVKERELGDRIIRNGDEGEDVKLMQTYLIQLEYSCGKWGADGDFGDATELAVKKFQKEHNCDDDGVYGPITHAALMDAIEKAKVSVETRTVVIVGGNCYVRSAPNTSGTKLGVAHEGDKLQYCGQISDNGWHLVDYNNQNGWVSGKYSKLED